MDISSNENFPEVTMCCLLHYNLSSDELITYWIREYEKAANCGINFRESLQEEYAIRKAKQQQTPLRLSQRAKAKMKSLVKC
jgi:hypothetical protein